MIDTKRKTNGLWFCVLLILGTLGLCLPHLADFAWGGGVCTAVWILSFLCLTDAYRSKRCTLISCGAFLIGYYLRFLGALDFEWLYVLLFVGMGLIQYGIFFVYSRLLRKWDHFIVTLAFPLIWLAVYLAAMVVRFPSLIRVDMMFADMNVLLQAEGMLGSFGLSFVILWILSLFAYAIGKRKIRAAVVGVVLYFAVLTVGVVYLYPNVDVNEYVRVGLSTGPYVGDYLEYTSLPMEEYLASMHTCVREAAEQGAEILVFNEETYEFDDTQEESFLAECSMAARENHIHVLVGMDLRDTDGSEGGRSLNKIVWIDQNGEILGSYLKTMTIPMLEDDYVRGDGTVPSHVITVGDKQIEVSYLICYDSNFPLFVNQMDDDTDILFLPSWDWPAVTEVHSMLCRTLAVDNRVSIVKSTYDGISIAVRPDGSLIGSFSTDEVGYAQVQVMDVPIEGRNGYTVAAARKENHVSTIIGVEILSILVCMILLYGSMVETREKSPRNRLYSIMVFTCAFAMAADAVSWIFDGCERLGPVLQVSTMLSLILSFVMTGEMIWYVTEYVRERKPISSVITHIYTWFTFGVTVLIIATSGTGLLFTYENGVYHDGPLYPTYVAVNLLCMLFCLVVSLLHMRSLSLHDRIAMMMYVLLPGVAGAINIFEETFSYAYPAVTLSMATLYVMLQSERADRLEKEGSKSYQRARQDVLTGLNNRLAFEERLKVLTRSEGSVGVIFTDMNGLKYANDHLGHAAGDRLLVRYAETLCRHFRKDDVFRISGDEFTVLIANVHEEGFAARMAKFEKILNADTPETACAGSAFGDACNVGELVKAAESDMYVKKQVFHQKHPELARN